MGNVVSGMVQHIDLRRLWRDFVQPFERFGEGITILNAGRVPAGMTEILHDPFPHWIDDWGKYDRDSRTRQRFLRHQGRPRAQCQEQVDLLIH